MRVTGLRRYPVKGLRGEDRATLDIEPCGPAGDRRWMVVRPDGSFMTQRRVPRMAALAAAMLPEGGLRLGSGAGSITVAKPDTGERLRVTVWRSVVDAAPAGLEADAWLSRRLGQPCRLVHLADPSARTVEPGPGVETGDTVSFADGFPLLLANTASLDALNAALGEAQGRPVPMDRFRANLVIDGSLAWQEDRWRRLRVGDLVFRAPKPCSRCIVVTLDQETGDVPQPGEPLRTLRRLNRHGDAIVFGRNLIPEAPGRIALGDPVEVLD